MILLLLYRRFNMQTLSTGNVISDFRDESVVVIGKIELDIDGEGDYQELPDVIDFEIDTNIENEVSRFAAYSFTITCLNTDDRYFSWNTASPKYDWLKQGRRIKIWAGINVNSTPYYYQWIIGRVDSYSLSTVAGEEICTIEGRDFMRTVLDYKLYSPNTHWGTSITFDTVASQADYQMPSSWSWDVSTAVYAEKFKLVSAEEDLPYDVTFSSDGSKMYIIGVDNDTVYQYSLSSSWDVSTASYASKFKDVSGEDTSPHAVIFSSDGTKMYIMGSITTTVYQYSLSSSWDVSTASYASKFKDVSDEDTVPRGVSLSSDGTKMYIIGEYNDTVYQYSLSSSWDVSTASYASKFKDVSDEDTSPYAVIFSSDGTKMYIMGVGNDIVYQYSLSIPWDVSTASYASKFKDVSDEDTSPRGVSLSSDGTKMYIMGVDNDTVYQYSLSTYSPAECTGIYIAYLDSISPYDGSHLFPIYRDLDFGYVEFTSKFSFFADYIPSYNGTNNLVVYYFTAKSIESVVGDILYYAGIFATTTLRDEWLADTSYVTLTGKEIDRVWFNTGTSAFEAIRLLAEVAQYRFYFDYAGNAVFKPKVSIGTSVDTFSDDCITEQESREDIDEVYNHIIVVGEKRETLG